MSVTVGRTVPCRAIPYRTVPCRTVPNILQERMSVTVGRARSAQEVDR